MRAVSRGTSGNSSGRALSVRASRGRGNCCGKTLSLLSSVIVCAPLLLLGGRAAVDRLFDDGDASR
jgi:hypothetical protein